MEARLKSAVDVVGWCATRHCLLRPHTIVTVQWLHPCNVCIRCTLLHLSVICCSLHLATLLSRTWCLCFSVPYSLPLSHSLALRRSTPVLSSIHLIYQSTHVRIACLAAFRSPPTLPDESLLPAFFWDAHSPLPAFFTRFLSPVSLFTLYNVRAPLSLAVPFRAPPRPAEPPDQPSLCSCPCHIPFIRNGVFVWDRWSLPKSDTRLAPRAWPAPSLLSLRGFYLSTI